MKFEIQKPSNDGSIVFSVRDYPELIELKANGDILIKGRLIENDKDLTDAFREFFRLAKSETV